MKHYVILIVLLICSGCDVAISEPQVNNEIVTVGFDNLVLEIPSRYFLSGISPLSDSLSLEASNEILLKLPMEELGFKYTGKNALVRNITLLISPITRHHKENQLGPDAIDAWTGTGLYRNRVIKFDKEVGLYRIASKAGHPKLWHYFKESPSKQNKKSANWVANCMTGPLDVEIKDMSNVACSATFISVPLQIEATFAGTHIKSFDTIHAAIISKIEVWSKK